ncbi:MAG: class I SAM-dependent methyltransferase [Actinomycetota bacterium]|nr:class I SAM-dependent methyltransferase [Actinomycetota bacterium]
MTWEHEAENWIAFARLESDAYWHYRDHFFELVPEPGVRTIEIGCGEGRVARDLKERGHSVVGIDSAPTLLAAAQALDPAGDYVLTDAADLPFEDESFGLAVAYNSLMDIDDMGGAVHEAWRVLKPGSRFCICVTHPINDAGDFEHGKPGAAFHIDVYRGRRPFDESFERDGVTVRFVGWCYPLEGYTQPLEEAGFLIEAIREPAVDRSDLAPHGEKRLRIPNFLLLRAVKPA